MADILIRGMDKPYNCFHCNLSYLRGERLFCHVTKDEVLRSKIAPDCPIHELPEHGDLIDRDALTKEINERIDAAIKWGVNAIADRDAEIKLRAEQAVATFCEASLAAKKLLTIVTASVKSKEATE